MARQRLATVTSEFGSGRRESHDSSPFYERFNPPLISDDEQVETPVILDTLFHGDAREMTDNQVADRSVALLITSPPYFAGKEYETDTTTGHVPASYIEYLELLEEVLAVCLRKLEPGGRMAVNVANLGRKPYRSLSSDVMAILQDRLGMLLRGEVIWQKAKGAGGSCAWGSYRSPQNPVLRDVTERVVIASKGRFDRAIKRERREALGLPHVATVATEEFLERTARWGGPHRVGFVIRRLAGPREPLALSVDNLVAALSPGPAEPDLELAAESLESARGRWRFRVLVINRNDESTDFGGLDSNLVELRLAGAIVGKVDPGDFTSWEPLWRGRERRTMRALREADTLRLHAARVGGKARLESGPIEIWTRGAGRPRIVARASFFLPGGRVLELTERPLFPSGTP
jgi:site-specific DNA-methyltransferase (adenine-specific)